ncbi:hypothetical protein [Myxosarcina sp. GI1(2024)]
MVVFEATAQTIAFKALANSDWGSAKTIGKRRSLYSGTVESK